MVEINVVSGDISKVKAGALITAINAGGMWFGGIDGVINKVAGNLFHEQAANASPLENGQAVVAHSNGHEHNGAFSDVVFVVDELVSPLGRVICNGLQAASDAGFSSVSLPTIRMGVMLGVVEKSTAEAVQEMARGVREFKSNNPDTTIETITFVVYSDAETERQLRSALEVH